MGQKQSAERSRNSFRTWLRRLRHPARSEASAPPPPYSPPASPLVESKKESRDTYPLNIILYDVLTPITITETNGRELVTALRGFAYSSVHHDQLAEVLGRVLGGAWDCLEPDHRPRRRPTREDVVNYLLQSFPDVRIELAYGSGGDLVETHPSNALYLDQVAMCGIPFFVTPSSVKYRDACTYRLLFHIYFAHQLARAVARYLLGIPEAGSSTSHPALLYPDVGFALEAQLHGAFLLFQCSEHDLSFDLRRDHAFFIEDPSRPGSAYVLPDDVLTDWANNIVDDFSNNRILRKPAIDFATATPAPPPPPGYIRCRLAQVFDPRPPRPAVPAGPPPEGYTRMAIGGMCRRGPVQRLAQEERDSS